MDDGLFVKILSNISYPQLYATFSCFQELAKENIESVVSKHLTGNLKIACLTMSILFLIYF